MRSNWLRDRSSQLSVQEHCTTRILRKRDAACPSPCSTLLSSVYQPNQEQPQLAQLRSIAARWTRSKRC